MVWVIAWMLKTIFLHKELTWPFLKQTRTMWNGGRRNPSFSSSLFLFLSNKMRARCFSFVFFRAPLRFVQPQLFVLSSMWCVYCTYNIPFSIVSFGKQQQPKEICSSSYVEKIAELHQQLKLPITQLKTDHINVEICM